MSFASPRYALLLIALLLTAGAGMVSLRHNPRHMDTCRDPAQLLSTDGLEVEGYSIFLGDPSEETSSPKRKARIDGYFTPENPGDPVLPFTIRRTFMLPNWLVRPTTALPGPAQPERFNTVVIDIDGTKVPIQFAYGMHRAGQRFVAYAMEYNGEPITSPFWTRMKHAPLALFRGIRPITYIGIAGYLSHQEVLKHEQKAIEFITAGWHHYLKACAP